MNSTGRCYRLINYMFLQRMVIVYQYTDSIRSSIFCAMYRHAYKISHQWKSLVREYIWRYDKFAGDVHVYTHTQNSLEQGIYAPKHSWLHLHFVIDYLKLVIQTCSNIRSAATSFMTSCQALGISTLRMISDDDDDRNCFMSGTAAEHSSDYLHQDLLNPALQSRRGTVSNT